MKKLRNKATVTLGILLLATISFTSCSEDDGTISTEEETYEDTEEEEENTTVDDPDFEPTDWTTETHSNDVDPNFEEVYEDLTIKRLDLIIGEDDWQDMLDDMTSKYGTFGRGGGPLTETDEDPIWVPASVFYKDKEWYKVGVRFKGNSSLQNSWQSGIMKLPFKLDFDEFEDDYPQIDNQRFYGFKQMSLKNNYQDRSMLREKMAGDIFRTARLPGAHTAFYSLYVDYGEGPVYFGVYTMVEEVDDTVIETQFSDDDGNLYKPDGDGASFAEGTFNETDFDKKSNEDEADWSDISSLFAALYDETRTTDPDTWRTNLETVFNTDAFLKYLAVNTVIQNWDTYGRMTHNYYLYNNPDTQRLTWVNWDNNEALQEGNMQGALNLDFSNLSTDQWPLIEYLYADETYKAKYDAFVKETIEGPFETSYIQSLYASYASILEPYATSENQGYTFLRSSSDFQTAISELNAHASERASAVYNYLE